MKNEVMKDTDLGIYIIKCIDVSFQKQDLESIFLVVDNVNPSQKKDIYLNLIISKIYKFNILTKESISLEIIKMCSKYKHISEYSQKMAKKACEYLINLKNPPIIRIALFPDKINDPSIKDPDTGKLNINNNTNGLIIPNFIVRTLSSTN